MHKFNKVGQEIIFRYPGSEESYITIRTSTWSQDGFTFHRLMLRCHINAYSSCSLYNRKFINVRNSYHCCKHYGFHQRIYLLIGVRYVSIVLYWSVQEVIMILQTGVVFNARLSVTQRERVSYSGLWSDRVCGLQNVKTGEGQSERHDRKRKLNRRSEVLCSKN